MRTFYLAGSWAYRDRCRVVAARIEREMGMRCLSRWLHTELDDNDNPEHRAVGARQDLEDVCRACEVVALVGDRASLGKHVEIGIALGYGVPVTLVLPPWGFSEKSFDPARCTFYSLCSGPYTLDEYIERDEG